MTLFKRSASPAERFSWRQHRGMIELWKNGLEKRLAIRFISSNEKRDASHPALEFLTTLQLIGYPESERLQAMWVMSSVFFPIFRKCSDVHR